MPNIIINLDPDYCTECTKKLFEDTFQLAADNNSAYVTPEHMLLCLVKEDGFMKYCDDQYVDAAALSAELGEYIDMLDLLDLEDEEAVPELSLGLQSVIDELRNNRDKALTPISIPDLLFQFSKLCDHFVAYIIEKYLGDMMEWYQKLLDVYATDICEGMAKMYESVGGGNAQDMLFDRLRASAKNLMDTISSLPNETANNDYNDPYGDDDYQAYGSRGPEPWEEYVLCVNDVYKHRNPLIGREAELERTMQILCRKEKNNPLHIGEAGVGKTALVYGLAAKIDKGDVPEKMRNHKIYMCDMGGLLAGTSYHGELEKRVKMMMDGLRKRGNCILYIDEIHIVMGSGNSGGGQNIANLLKPYLEDGSVKFIGSTTYQEYNRHIASDKAFARRFQQIDVLEPSVEETVKIVEALLPNFERFHGVKYDMDAVRYAVEKSNELIADRYQPDKAIDIIDEAGAYRQMHPLYNKKGEKMSSGRQKVGKDIFSDVMSKVCKINAKALTEDNSASLRNLEENIRKEIYGQDEAVSKVVRAVKMSKAGLIPTDKPLASLLFVGPTGVGKTEVCKVLAKELGVELVRFDMSEYTEKHTVAKLIGSPAGYVGYDDGGLLTDAIRKSPNCVLLLDEIEKAHQDIYNILLQVMDYARLTDNKGNKADFKNVVLIMTSNAGAQYAAQAAVGFTGGQTRGEAMMQTVKKTFKPEFLNRLSGTVVFGDMDLHMAQLILDKKLKQLSEMLVRKSVTLTLADDARQLLLDKGFTAQYGAREMDRVIQNMLTPLLIDEILFGKLAKGGEAVVKRNGDKLVLE